MRMGQKTLVLGLGNTLLGDEGVGVHALEFLRQRPELDESVELLDGGTLSFTLAGPIEDADALIVIDAAELGKAAGTVQLFEGESMDHFVGHGKKSSVHEVSLVDLMAIAQLTQRLPKQRALIGIQPDYVDWAETPTEVVGKAIPVAGYMALDLIRRWQQ